MPYLVKKGAADPFRGDWYITAETFESRSEAIAHALQLTQTEYNQLQTSWEQFGYEWSVFERIDNHEHKIWEGYKAIKVMEQNNRSNLSETDGSMH